MLPSIARIAGPLETMKARSLRLDESPGYRPLKGFQIARVAEIQSHIPAFDVPVSAQALSKPINERVWLGLGRYPPDAMEGKAARRLGPGPELGTSVAAVPTRRARLSNVIRGIVPGTYGTRLDSGQVRPERCVHAAARLRAGRLQR